jgi:hypothetical protein
MLPREVGKVGIDARYAYHSVLSSLVADIAVQRGLHVALFLPNLEFTYSYVAV